MGLKIVLPKALEERLRREAMKRFGYGKGAISRAVEQALRIWLKPSGTSSELLDEERERSDELYRKLRGELESKYYGKMVVLTSQGVIASGDDLESVCKEVRGRDYPHMVFIRVGEPHAPRRMLGWRVSMRRRVAGA